MPTKTYIEQKTCYCPALTGLAVYRFIHTAKYSCILTGVGWFGWLGCLFFKTFR